MFGLNEKKVNSTPLSEFVRHTKSADKKKIYQKVILAATESQKAVIEKAKSAS